MLGVELDQRLGVVDRRLDLCLAAYDLRVREQPGDVRWAVFGDGDGIEARERFADAFPFGVDHAPVHPCLKHWPGQRLQVPCKIWGPPWWRRRAVHPDPPLIRPGGPRTSPRTAGRRRSPRPKRSCRRAPGTTR